MAQLRIPSVALLTSVLLGGVACDDEGPHDPGSRAQQSDSIGQNATTQTAVAGSSAGSAQGIGSGTAVDARAYAADGGVDAGQGTARLADAQIVSVLSTVNAGAIERGTVATDAAQAASVRAYAQELIDTRLAAQERLTRLVATTSFAAAVNVADAENVVADELLNDSKQLVTRLQDAEAARFDVLFLQAQTQVLTRVLDVIDTRLLPSVESALLRAEIERVRAETIVLLQRARVLLAALDADADGGVADVDAGF